MNLQDLTAQDVVIIERDGEEVEATIETIAKGWIALDDGTKIRAKAVISVVEGDDEEGDDEEGEAESKMAKQIKKYREGYNHATDYSGRATLNTGDELADLLTALDPEQVMLLAMNVIFECPDLISKYANLNNGSKRMNAGNRIRAAIKNGDLKLSEIKAGQKAIVKAAAEQAG